MPWERRGPQEASQLVKTFHADLWLSQHPASGLCQPVRHPSPRERTESERSVLLRDPCPQLPTMILKEAGRYVGGHELPASVHSQELSRISERHLGYRYADDRIFINGGCGPGRCWEPSPMSSLPTTSRRHRPASRRHLSRPAGYCSAVSGCTATNWCTTGRSRRVDGSRTTRPSLEGDRHVPHLGGESRRTHRHLHPAATWTLMVQLGDFPRTTTDPLSAVAAKVTDTAEERFTRADLARGGRAPDIHEVFSRHGAEPLTHRELSG